jgi:transposase-like protein
MQTNMRRNTVTVPTTIDASEFLVKHLESDPDLLREMVSCFAQALMAAEVDGVCGAGYGEVSSERVNRRNGYRTRRWDTRVGTIDLPIPKLREGSYFPGWLLEPRRRAEQALVSVVAQCYVEGVSTRRVEDIASTMGVEGLSRSQVSEMARSLDAKVDEFRNRPLDRGPYTYLWLDALTQRVREGGRVVLVSVVCATAVNADGYRESLGLEVITTEDGAGWLSFLRSLVARGLRGVALVISDAHEGLTSAIASVLPGATWQRCRTHFVANLQTKVPKASWPMVAPLVRSIFDQPDRDSVWAQHAMVVERLRGAGLSDAADMLTDAADDVLAHTAFPKEHWRQIRSNNPQERQNREIRRRTDVVGIFPDRRAIIRLVGAVLAEQTDEWAVARRYMSADSLANARVHLIDTTAVAERKEETLHELAEVS